MTSKINSLPLSLTKHLKSYLYYCELEKGLSENTIYSYRNDIEKLLNYLNDDRIDNYRNITLRNLELFFNELYEIGLSKSSVVEKLGYPQRNYGDQFVYITYPHSYWSLEIKFKSNKMFYLKWVLEPPKT